MPHDLTFMRRLSIELRVAVPRTSAVSATTHMGNLSVRDVASTDARASMGNVSVRVPSTLRAAYDLHTGMGTSHLDAPSSPDGPPISVRSGMGNVTIRTHS